ncbi:DUF2935 domain-containing protein [Dysosmobacter sp.]|uniref:DUF2935 domain-containing protein n=1 Tax=Dysosmobacter sp. TaxID=2591382 RepID=UPI002A85DAF2|nr:DUF2935 domain-containing protein [Dysosmobacter sp.]MDY3282459.1 DUF2935 domain-containing protein [Dysosmobacter sp.]
MDRTQAYITDSLELHLFFARIMKEHAFFLTVGLLPPARELAREGETLMRRLEGVLSRAIALSGCAVRCRVLDSGEAVTEFTDLAECQTGKFTGLMPDRSLTARTLALRGREEETPPAPVRQVRQLNREALALVEQLIRYKLRLLDLVNGCAVFTANYPLLIQHILREARLYRSHLLRLEGMGCGSARELRDSELFWDRIMMEHALFIRGLLDPTEEDLIAAANRFAGDYRRLLDTAADRIVPSRETADLTQRFRDFKRSGVEGIEGCRIRSLILPLLADHVLREANHYLRLLGE